MTERVDVVVIGAGGMGAATAWRLAEHGRSVVLLEQFEHLHTRGSSHGQTRIFRVAYRDPLYTRLAGDSIALWRELEDAAGVDLLEQSGQLDHGDPSAMDEIEASLVGHGFRAERLDCRTAGERWPSLVFDRAVVHSPDGGRVFADRTVDAAVQVAVDLGVDYRERSPVERIEPAASGAFVHAAGRTWQADCVVVAAGPWVGGLLEHLVPLPPLRITVQQPAHFAIRDGFQFPSFIHHPGRTGALAYGAYGLASPGEGVKLGLEDTVHEIDIADRTFDLNEDVSKALVAYADRWLPGADPRRMTATTCLFTETADGHFILDRVGPIVVCSPCSGHGFKFVPIIGEIAAQLAMGNDHGEQAWRLRPSDFIRVKAEALVAARR